MKLDLKKLSVGYQAALCQYLKPGPRGSLLAARKLGREAVGMGMETLALARMHECSLASPELVHSKNGAIKRAEKFFNEANRGIEETRGAARHSTVHFDRLKETLDQRTAELAATNRQLKRGVVRHKVREDAFAKRKQSYKNSLEESLQLQNRLRQLTHRVLVAQEDER